MASVQTVLGPVPAENLGPVLPYEQVAPVRMMGVGTAVLQDFLGPELHRLSRWGCRTVVDVSPYRDVYLQRSLAQAAGVNIVSATGFGLADTIPDHLQHASSDALCVRFLREITVGIGGSAGKAGVISVRVGAAPAAGVERRVLAAAARAQRSTGAPIIAHAWWGLQEVLDCLESEGADLGRVMLADADRTTGGDHLSYLVALAQRGAYVCFSGWGLLGRAPYDVQARLVQGMMERGHISKLLFSLGFGYSFDPTNGQIDMHRHSDYHGPLQAPNRYFAFMFTHVIPSLIKGGLAQDDLDTILEENPRKLLETHTS